MQTTWMDYSIIVIYMLGLICVGLYFSKGKKTTANYLLGGRNMPTLAIGIAIMMSLLSSISIVMIPGETYSHGLMLFFIATVVGPFLAIPCYLLFTRFYFKLGSFTPYEYLEYRYDPTVRALVAFSSFYAKVIYLAMVLYSTAKIFESSYNWSPFTTILMIGTVGTIYTVMGGSKAVIWTDVFQFFILVGGFVVIVAVLCWKIDGGAVTAITTALKDGHGVPEFSEASFYSISPYVRILIWLRLWDVVTSNLVSCCSDQVEIQRLLSTKNWKSGLKAKIISAFLGLPLNLILWFVGFALYTYYKQNPDKTIGLNGDSALFHFISFNMPSPLSGLFMAGMLAAVMSTLCSGMNAMATIWLKEIHQKFINRNLTQEREILVSKFATVLLAVFATSCALCLNFAGKWLQQSVAEVSTIFWLLGAAILPAFLFAVLSPRANSRLIWGYTFFSFGEGIAMNAWYVMSRAARQAWEADPTQAWGWAGPLDFRYMLYYALPGMLLCLPWLYPQLRKLWQTKLAALLGLCFLGVAEAMLIWYAYSQWLITTEPQARSFTFYPPIAFFAAFIILCFCPKQPKEKYQGLTLGTMNKEMLVPIQEKE